MYLCIIVNQTIKNIMTLEHQNQKENLADKIEEQIQERLYCNTIDKLSHLGFDHDYLKMFKNHTHRSLYQDTQTFCQEHFNYEYDERDDYVYGINDEHNTVILKALNTECVLKYDRELKETRLTVFICDDFEKQVSFEFPDLYEEQIFNVADGFLFSSYKFA